MFASSLYFSTSMIKTFLSVILILYAIAASAQKKDYKPVIISFYNLENLYDTVDNPITNDEEFLPNGIRNQSTIKIQERWAVGKENIMCLFFLAG